MPRQLTFLGHPIPRIPPRRVAILLASISIFALFTLLFTLPSSIPTGPSLSKFADTHVPKLPSGSLWNPFRDAAHEPPVQKNSSSGDSSWFSDWKWLKPYSSQITLDENRSLLPPLPERPPIYAYYDHPQKRSDNLKEDDEALKEAENAILVTWRRAWWAQGFKPIILGPAEATNNPHHEELQKLELDDGIKTEMLRWLAWENMGAGLLCNYMALPMGSYDDPLLSFLRRGSYPSLTRFEGLGSGLFAGDHKVITEAVKKALANPALNNVKDIIGAVPAATFDVDPQHDSIAYYHDEVLKNKYLAVSNAFGTATSPTVAKGLSALNNLINAHLHDTWQNHFSSGIAVLKPGRKYMNALLEPTLQLAKFLSQCSDTNPMPGSCPPNIPKCKPCVASVPMKITTPENYMNKSDLYTIGIVPHPYTLATLASAREEIDIPWIRRESERDPWLSIITKVIRGSGVSGPPRVVAFKEAVASPYSFARSIWMTAEKEIPNDLDWRFGFAIARDEADTGKSETPVPGPERRPKAEDAPEFKDLPVPTETEIEAQKRLISRAQEFLKETEEGGDKKGKGLVVGGGGKNGGKGDGKAKVRKAVEMWNLADTEAWKFARAFLARGRVERLKWEEEERGFAGGVGIGSGGRDNKGGGRWFD